MRQFYVSVKDAGRSGFLLGPYDTHEEAKQNVERGREMAQKMDARACFYAFGTCSAPVGTIKQTVFGR